MNEEMKTRSIRADEETLDKFKALSESFGNQGECLASLIKAYEVSKAKSVLSDVKTNIADYESHINAIQDIFLSLLESLQNTETRIRNDYAVRLDADAKTILDLQIRLDKALEKSEKMSAEVESLNEDNSSYIKQMADLDSLNNNYIDQLNDKKEIINSLNAQLSDYLRIKDEYETKNQIIADFKAERAEQAAELKRLESEIDKLKAEQETHKKQAEIEKQAEIDKLKTEIETLKKQFELDKQIAVTEVKAEYLEKLERVREEKEKILAELHESERQRKEQEINK